MRDKGGEFNYSFRLYEWNRVIEPLIIEHGTSWMLEKDVINAMVKLADIHPWEHPWGGKYDLKPGDVYVEAGAFHGRYARDIIKRFNEDVTIILIEPSPINFEVIQTWVKQQNLEDVILVDCALGDERKDWMLVEPKDLSSARLGNFQYEPEERHKDCSVDVLIDTLDNVMGNLGIDHIDLLSADIEGAEISMLKGSKRLLSHGRIHNVALAGYHGASSSDEIIKFLQCYDYKDLVYENAVVYGHV